MALSKKFKFTADTFFTVDPSNKVTGRGLKEEYLEQILDAIAECQGGYSACRGGLILIDTVTGVKNLITLDNGILVDTPITD